jgi:WD40 repeat protein
VRLLQNTQARPVGGVAFGPHGRILVAGGSGGYDVWELATSSHAFIASHNVKYLYGCICDPLGRWIYVSDYVGGFRLLPLGGKGRPAPGSPHERHVVSFALTPDGRRLVLSRGGGGSNRVECWAVGRPASFNAVWSIRDGEPIDPGEPYLLNQAGWFTNAVALNPGGSRAATTEHRSGSGLSGARGGLLVIRDGATGRAIAELGTSATSLGARMVFAPDGGVVFTWDSRVIERWDVATGRQTGQRPAPGRAYFLDGAIHPSGRFLLTVAGDGLARYWDPATLSPVQTLKWPVGKLHSVAFSPDGMLAAAGGDKGRVVVWDVDV